MLDTVKKNKLFRETVLRILTESSSPMTTNQIANHPEIVPLGYTMTEISTLLRGLALSKTNNIQREVIEGYKARYQYYISNVSDEPKPQTLDSTAESITVSAEPSEKGVRCITLDINGITIRIEIS